MTKTRKTTPKKTARKPAVKPTRKKTSRSKKRNKSFFSYPLLMAFMAGAMLALLLFFGLSIVSQERHMEQVAQKNAKDSSILLDHSKSPSRPPIKFNQPTQKPAQPPLPPETQSAVKKALEELQDLPYEDQYTPSLTEEQSFIDYAILQALLKNSVPIENFEITAQTPRIYKDEPYKLQQINIFFPGNPSNFEENLRNNLKIWTENAKLTILSPRSWEIYSGTVLTHSITLLKQQTAGRESATQPIGTSDGSMPQLVIVMDDLGASMGPVQQLLNLDYPVTLAFWPKASKTAQGAKMAWAKGREIIIHQPMEPLGYPRVNSGKGTLTVHMDKKTIQSMVAESFTLVPHAVGLNNHMGSKFTQDRKRVSAVVDVLRENNMFLLDSLTHHRSVLFDEGVRQGVRVFKRDIFLDLTHTKENALAELAKAEKIALLKGKAIAIGHPLPGTLKALEEWQHVRNKSIQVVRLQDLR